MNKFAKAALIATLFGSATAVFAAPGLTVSGTDLMYNGKKIFFSGTNLAWADYNSDVGESPLDENAWRKAVEGTRAAGGNAIRWWLFNNMSQSPAIDPTTHLVTGLKASTLANMKKALDIAEEYGVMVSMCLFSHNLMEPNQWGIYDGEKLDFTANQNLFTDEGTTAFINNVLVPVVKGVGNHNALMTWEVFNEPEGMTSVGWTTKKLDKATLQKFTNKVAAAIHTTNPELLVSTGSVNIQYQEWWNDANLVAAGGEANGTLDFFQTHYYPYYQNDAVSPFVNTAAEMQVKYKYDAKPMIIGEFPASGWTLADGTRTTSMAAKTDVSTEQAYKFAYESGYAGALAWQYIGDKTESNFGGYSYTIDPALDAMTKLAATAEASIKIKDVAISTEGGDGKMAVTYGDDNAQIEYQNKGGWDLSGATTFTWTAKNNGDAPADLYLILKLTDSWKWTETDGSCEVPAGEKVTCSIDISDLADRNKTLSVVIANYAAGYTGTVVYDDFAAGDKVLFNFNEDRYDAFSRGYGNTEEQIPEIKIVYNENYVMGGNAAADPAAIRATGAVAASKMNVVGNSIMFTSATAGDVSVEVFGMNGKRVATLFHGILNAGTHAFDMSELSKGQYIVRVKGVGISATQIINR
ncbi:cellulase family glycosylhydrolase [Fibrobacter sp. UWEL]|uniref:cellulase family glycosylhydrolase n=1 Tax=Fibrobacter sp. UWEL TaxID=1896209 RepID=UPI000912D019|nr:cellulase family glycosylhydrolase [Fibrobacter sp. UWEL]SHK62591.1 Por secretion system C-terminal sorting domain-containing protein [Fibrobacter sp. UWEL]